jgi:hypothetical protein
MLTSVSKRFCGAIDDMSDFASSLSPQETFLSFDYSIPKPVDAIVIAILSFSSKSLKMRQEESHLLLEEQ